MSVHQFVWETFENLPIVFADRRRLLVVAVQRQVTRLIDIVVVVVGRPLGLDVIVLGLFAAHWSFFYSGHWPHSPRSLFALLLLI